MLGVYGLILTNIFTVQHHVSKDIAWTVANFNQRFCSLWQHACGILCYYKNCM